MATIAAFKTAPTAARRISSSWPAQSLAGSGRSPCERRSVSCIFGILSRVSLVRARSFPARVGSLYSVAEPTVGPARALPHRRAFRVLKYSSSGEMSGPTVEEVAKKLEKQVEEAKAAYDEAVSALEEHSKKLKGDSKILKDHLRISQNSASVQRPIEVLRDTIEKLKEQAEKALAKLIATAMETAEIGKSNLYLIAEKGPDPIKGIAESAVNAHLKDNVRQGAKIHDFCLGIPYGAFLVTGGFLWFILTGRPAAVRFGIFLGGLLLFLSVMSLKVWKEGKSSIPYVNGQAAIAFIIFVNDARRFFETGAFSPRALSALISGGILAFYVYVYLSGGNPPKKLKTGEPTAAT